MPPAGPTPRGFHARRLVSRALLVAGATAAGTGATWLVGALSPAEAATVPHDAEPAAVSAAASAVSIVDGHVPGQSGERHDPAHFGLDDLESAVLVASDSAHAIAPGPALWQGGPVERAAGGVLASAQKLSPPAGLGQATKTLSPEGTRASSAYPVPDRAAVAPHSTKQSALRAGAPRADHTASAESPSEQGASRNGPVMRGFSHPSWSAVASCANSGAARDAFWTDSYNGAGLCWIPSRTGADDSLAARPPARSPGPAGVPRPQPGVTPD